MKGLKNLTYVKCFKAFSIIDLEKDINKEIETSQSKIVQIVDLNFSSCLSFLIVFEKELN